MKRRLAALLLAAVMLISVIPAAFAANISDFTDVTGHWGYSYIKWGVEKNLFNGVSKTEFAPDDGMTRAMFVTVLGRLAETYSKKTSGFSADKLTDVVPGSWYSQYVAWAYANKLVEGYTDGTFGVNNLITREEMCVIMMRFLQYMGEAVDSKEKTNTFDDAADVSAWAVKGVNVCIGYELLLGMGGNKLAPKQTATRAQVAALLSRLDLTVKEVISGGGSSSYTDLLAQQVEASTPIVEDAFWNFAEAAATEAGTPLPSLGITRDSVKATYNNYAITVEVSAELAAHWKELAKVGADATGLSKAQWMNLITSDLDTLSAEAKAYGTLATSAKLALSGTDLIEGQYATYAALYTAAGTKEEKAKAVVNQLLADKLISENDAVNLAMDTQQTVLEALAAKNDVSVTMQLTFDALKSYYHENYTIVVKTKDAANLSDSAAAAADKAAKLLDKTTYRNRTFTTDISEVAYWKQLHMMLKGAQATIDQGIAGATQQAEAMKGASLTQSEKQDVIKRVIQDQLGADVTLYSPEFWALAIDKFAGSQFDYSRLTKAAKELLNGQDVAALFDKAEISGPASSRITAADVNTLKAQLAAQTTDVGCLTELIRFLDNEVGISMNNLADSGYTSTFFKAAKTVDGTTYQLRLEIVLH